MSEYASEFITKSGRYIHPKYKLHRVIQQTGGQQMVLPVGGGLDSIFEIPVRFMNFAQSYLYFTVSLPALAAATYGADKINWFFTDAITPILQIQLYTKAGTYLADLNFVPNYTKVVGKVETPLSEYLSLPTMQDSGIAAQSMGQFLGRNNSLGTSTTRTVVAPFALRFDNTASSVNYTEPKYLEPGSAANTADPNFVCYIPLSKFKNTIFAYDKTIFLGEIVYIRIVWDNTNRIAYGGTSATNPTTALSAYQSNITLNGLTLYLALDNDQEQNNLILSQVASAGGFQAEIPIAQKEVPGLSTSHTLTYKFNSGNGRTLEKIYIIPYNITETTNVAYDHDNLAGNGKVRTFYTMLDNNRLQEFDVTAAMYPYLKDSPIQNANVYRHNWFYLEDFSNLVNKDGKDSNLSGGLEEKWEFYASSLSDGATPVNYNYYSFAVTKKLLTVTSAGIIFQ